MTDTHAKRLRRLANNGYCADILRNSADHIEALEKAYAQQQQVWSDAIACADRYEAALRVAAGYISTKEGHTDQHPQDVYDWIIRAALEVETL